MAGIELKRGLGMSCKIRRTLELPSVPAADRKMHQRTRPGIESTGRPIALVVSSVIFGALLGFAQPASADALNGQAALANQDAYSALVSYAQSIGTTQPKLTAAPSDGYGVLRDFVRANQAGHPMVVAAAELAANPAVKSDASLGDAYSALANFGQASRSDEPTLVFAKLAKSSKVKKSVAAAPAADEYAKTDPQTCLGCHGQDPHVAAFLKSPMARKGDPRTPMAPGGCESCHGPSAAHVASRMKGGNRLPADRFNGPDAAPVEQRNEICLGCHQTTAMLINWQGSQMQRAGVACTDCHTVMAAKDPVLVKKTQPQVCFACHAEQRADSFKYSHHPIREGNVVCSDCHNPMGSAGPHLLKEFSVNETCYNCHADKRGPMLWEHQPVREDCTNCHTPHGSSEARLMKEPMGFMCSSCHSDAWPDQSGGAFGGAHALPGNLPAEATFNSALGNQRLCLNCHSQIHGSNSPNGAYFFR